MRLDNFYIAVLIIVTLLLVSLNHHVRHHGEINPDLYISEVVKVVEVPLRKVVRVTISAVKSVTRWLIGLSEDDATAYLNHNGLLNCNGLVEPEARRAEVPVPRC